MLPQEHPENLEAVDLEPNRIPSFVMLVEQQIPPLFSGTGISIPNGIDTFIQVEKGDSFLVKLRLSGSQLALATEWWFLVRYAPIEGADTDGAVEQKYELVPEQVPPPQEIMPYQWAEWAQ